MAFCTRKDAVRIPAGDVLLVEEVPHGAEELDLLGQCVVRTQVERGVSRNQATTTIHAFSARVLRVHILLGRVMGKHTALEGTLAVADAQVCHQFGRIGQAIALPVNAADDLLAVVAADAITALKAFVTA
mgnify:CR=1 FL=1